MTIFSDEPKESSSPPTVESTPLRRKSAYVACQNEGSLIRRQPSLQVSHYPALLKDGEEAQQSSVIWKTIHDTPPPEVLLLPHSPPSLRSSPCSPSRLLRPHRMSFSTVANAVNTTLKQHQGRCLSSASPMSATERQQLWDSVMRNSLDHIGSASAESLYNSCNDLDSRTIPRPSSAEKLLEPDPYRQQRKRRPGISGGSTVQMRGDPFACAGGSGCSSAGIASGRGQLGGRSPQSSFDSNTDVAQVSCRCRGSNLHDSGHLSVSQISMNWMRMNGLGQGVRPLLTGSPNPPKVSHSSSHLSRAGSLKKMNAVVSSLDERFPHTGSKFDVSNHHEESSRKSVSIAYSNDIEGQKHGDDSETPLMLEKEDNSGGRLIKREQLHEKRRLMCDRALICSLIGIFLMIFENELRAANVINTGSYSSSALKSLNVVVTAALLFFVGYFHVIEVQLFMNANAADDWRVSLTTRRVAQILVEIAVCSLCPLPLEFGKWGRDKVNARFMYNMNSYLSIAMFLRLYWLCRVMLLHSRLFTDASSRSIAGLNRVNFNARFILKTLMTLCPGTVLIVFTSGLWLITGWILRVCESVDKRKDMDYVSSIWLVAITFLSVGYGDIVPQTNCGRTAAVITGILGTCTSSMVVAVIARKLELTRAEKHVHNFMMDTQLTKQLKHSAANVLRETWLIYKYRKKVEKPDYAKIRQHQRKFLVAIYELRKVKRDQRKLAENLVSLGDIAKSSSNTYELIHDVHSTQEGLSLRITAIEHQLSDISREIGNLAELIRGRRQSQNSDQDNTSPVMMRHHRRKHGELLE